MLRLRSLTSSYSRLSRFVVNISIRNNNSWLEDDTVFLDEEQQPLSRTDMVRMEQEHRHAIKQQIILKKNFPMPKEAAVLTWEAMEQMRFLYKEFPEEWTIDRIIESFPVSRHAALQILKSSGSRFNTEAAIIKHNLKVRRNLEALQSGNLEGNEQLTNVLRSLTESNKMSLLSNSGGVQGLPMPTIEQSYPNASKELSFKEQLAQLRVTPFTSILAKYNRLESGEEETVKMLDSPKTQHKKEGMSQFDKKLTSGDSPRSQHGNLQRSKFGGSPSSMYGTPWTKSDNSPGTKFSNSPRAMIGDLPRSEYGDSHRSEYGDSQMSGYSDLPRSKYGDSQRSGYGDLPRSKSGDSQRSGYGDLPKSEYGDSQMSGYGDLPRSKYGDSQRSGYGHLPRSKSGDSQRSGYGDLPRSKYGDSQKSGYGDIPRSKSGDSQRSGYGDLPRSKSGDSQRSGYGDLPRSKSGDSQRSKSGDSQRSEYGDSPRSEYGDSSRSKFSNTPKLQHGDLPKSESDDASRSRSLRSKSNVSSRSKSHAVQTSPYDCYTSNLPSMTDIGSDSIESLYMEQEENHAVHPEIEKNSTKKYLSRKEKKKLQQTKVQALPSFKTWEEMAMHGTGKKLQH